MTEHGRLRGEDRTAQPLQDEEVRKMFVKAGFDVNSSTDVAAFSQLMRYLFAWHEARVQSATTRKTWIVAAITATITTSVPMVLHFVFKVM